MILYAGKEVLERSSRASVKTISVPVSSAMAPAFRIFVYHVTQNFEIISDSLTIPVDGISRHKVVCQCVILALMVIIVLLYFYL